MPYYDRDDRDDEDDLLDESEYPEPDSDDDDGTAPCPYCGKAKYEESEICPYCENYVSREDTRGRQPMWIVLGIIACLAIASTWVLGR
ncbi:MAG: hypothetical protein K2R98_12060 [Gemmataceae bacterium]|nr:hypothetical protein [Gemmataceae bacterium]